MKNYRFAYSKNDLGLRPQYLKRMPVYRFRVQKEDHDDSYRDIDIKPNQTFDDFSSCLQVAIKFDGKAIPHFFMSDLVWRKLEEVTPFITTKTGDTFETEIADFVDDPHQRFLLYLDTNGEVKLFHVELIKIIKDEERGAVYPYCSKEVGKPPRQYKRVINAKAIPDEEEAKLIDKFFDDSAIDDTEAYQAEEEVGLDDDDETELKEGFTEEGDADADEEGDEDASEGGDDVFGSEFEAGSGEEDY